MPGQMDVASLNRGRLRHPLFGNRKHWYDQAVKPGFWDDAMKRGEGETRRLVVAALDAAIQRLKHSH